MRSDVIFDCHAMQQHSKILFSHGRQIQPRVSSFTLSGKRFSVTDGTTALKLLSYQRVRGLRLFLNQYLVMPMELKAAVGAVDAPLVRELSSCKMPCHQRVLMLQRVITFSCEACEDVVIVVVIIFLCDVTAKSFRHYSRLVLDLCDVELVQHTRFVLL